MDSTGYAIPTESEIDIPRPSDALLVAINKYTGMCLGLVIAVLDARQRKIPNWLSVSAHEYIVWDGQYIMVEDAKHITTEWYLA